MFWFFKRGKENKELKTNVTKLHSSMSDSFKNIKEDMHHIGSWLHHFKGKHEDHEKQFSILLQRMSRVEYSLADLREKFEGRDISSESEFELVKEPEESIDLSGSAWDSLTETQQKICWKLALLQKELPDQWVSLKYLAQELYPEKDYNQVRSALSQFIGGLEELGFVKRRRKGKQAYVYSTKKNPCSSKKKKTEITMAVKN